MEALRAKQLEMQKEAASELLEKIETVQKGSKVGLHSQKGSFAIAKALVPYHTALKKEIGLLKEEQIKGIVRRLIRQNEALFQEIFGVSYKNLDDPLGGPLTQTVLFNREHIYWESKKHMPLRAVSMLQEAKKEFAEMSESALEERLDEAFEFFKDRLAFDGGCYEALALPKDEDTVFANDAERIAVALLPLEDGEIASAVLTQILSLLYKSRADEEATETDRQDVAKEIGEWLYGRLGWQVLTKLEKKEKEELYKGLEEWRYSGIWELRLIHAVGHEMLDLVDDNLKKLGLEVIKISQNEGEKRETTRVRLQKEFLEKLKKVDKRALAQFSLVYKPMVVPPVDWPGLRGGGFLQGEGIDRRFDLMLIKASNRKDEEVLKGKEIPKPVLQAVNRLQKVPYRINRRILEVLRRYYDKLKYIRKKNRVDFDYYLILQRILNEKLYERALSEIYEIVSKSEKRYRRKGVITKEAKKRVDKALEDIKKAQEKERFEIFALENQLFYDIAKYGNGFDTMMAIAEEMKEYERFYFVWQMDFRGRVYPKQTLLHPQGGDIAKSLLLFADGKALDERGVFWLKVHGANVYGEVDKRPFDERIAWVDAHEAQILQSAEDPEKASFWKEADDPFKFLAFCFEFAEWKRNPETFESSLPIAIDGSNNGFQHVATLLRDVDGARRVNVLPKYDENGKMIVSDIYADVAGRFKQKLQSAAEMFEQELQTDSQAFEPMGTVYYKKEEILRFVPATYAKELCEAIEAIPSQKLETGRKIYRLMQKELSLKLDKKTKEALEVWVKKIENEIRKEEEDSEEIRYLLIDRLSSEGRRAQRKVQKGEFEIQGNVIYEKKEEKKLVIESFFRLLLEKGLINRSFVKKPVMTESYGSGTKGKANSIAETLEKKGLLHQLDWKERKEVSEELARLVEESLDEISPSASTYNDWIKKFVTAKVPFREGEEAICDQKTHCVKQQSSPSKDEKDKGYDRRCEIACVPQWTTPLGLKVIQSEWKTKEYKLSVARDKKVTVRVYTDEIDFKEHKQGLPPNYIHSLDATHLVMTINRLEEDGIVHIATAHDSFAVHAVDVSKLSKILRETFVALHRRPLLENVRGEFSQKFGYDRFDQVPYIGDPDAFPFDEILKSEYIFA